MHKAGESGARADKDRLKAVGKQLVDGQHLADDHIGLNLHTERTQRVDLLLHDALRETELRNTVDEHAARQM